VACRSRSRHASRWASSAVLLVVLAAGCGGSSAEPKLPAKVGAALERQAKAVETALDEGDTATAEQQAAALVSAIDDAVAAGQVPVALQDELRAGAQRLLSLASGTAEPPPPPPPPAEDKGKGKKKKKGHDKGDGGSASTSTTSTDTAPTTSTETTPTTTDTTPAATGTGQ
jgi:hypothetical protein